MKADTKNIAIAGGIIAIIAIIVYLVKTGKMNSISNRINTPAVGGGTQYGPSTGIGGGLPDTRRILGIGTKGTEVGNLQAMLNADGASPALAVDNDFGPKTLAALQAETGRSEITLEQYEEFRNRSTPTTTAQNGGITGNAIWGGENYL